MEQMEIVDDDDSRRKNREQVLLNLSKLKFSNQAARMMQGMASSGSIKIELKVPREVSIFEKLALELHPDIDLMTDEASNYNQVFDYALELADQVLSNPPRKQMVHQGAIVLDKGGARWRE